MSQTTIYAHPGDQNAPNSGKLRETTPIRPLPRVLRNNGFDLTQVMRDGDVAVYRQTKKNRSVEDYEVIVIGTRKSGAFKGNPFEAKETYPKSKSWGKRGWTYRTKAEAVAKFNELCEGKES